MTSHALKSFWKCYDQLPARIRKLADKNFALFKANPWHPPWGLARKVKSILLKSVAATAH